MSDPYVFLSYSRKDAEFVDRLSNDLQQAGVRIWKDTEQINPGEQWLHAIENALNDAVVLLYVSSRNSRGSGWVDAELSSIVGSSGESVVPIIIDDKGEEDLPHVLRAYQWVDFRTTYDKALGELLAIFPDSVKEPNAIPTPPNSSKGYVFISYTEEDSDFVEDLRVFLSDKDYGYWDYAESDRDYHSQFVRELEGVIRDAAATLTVLSESWKDSTWAMREFFFSEEIGTPVFLLKAKEMEPSLAVAGSSYISFVEDPEYGYQKLGRELKRKGL